MVVRMHLWSCRSRLRTWSRIRRGVRVRPGGKSWSRAPARSALSPCSVRRGSPGRLQPPTGQQRGSRKGGTLVIGADSVGVDFVPPHVFAGRGLSIAKFAIFDSLYDYPNGDLSKPLQPVLASGPPKVSAGRAPLHGAAQEGCQVPRRDSIRCRSRGVQLHAVPRQEPSVLRSERDVSAELRC